MKKAACCMVSVLLILTFTLALTGCGATLKEAARLSEYDLGDDVIPSITSVVGEREVTGMESSTNNGVASKQYTYVSDTVYDDLWTYVQKLMDDGWLVTKDIDLNVIPGSGQLGRNASEEGRILLLSFAYEDGKYAIKITKAEGTIE